MKTISSFHDIEKVVGEALLKQSQLDRAHILNGLSVRGVNLAKYITDTVSLSYDLNDCVLIFEVVPVENDNINVTEEIEDDMILQYIYNEVKVVIYGNESYNLATLLKSRLESEKNQYDMFIKGVSLLKSSVCTSITEFINETIYPRADFSFYVVSELHHTQVDTMNQIKIVETNVEDD